MKQQEEGRQTSQLSNAIILVLLLFFSVINMHRRSIRPSHPFFQIATSNTKFAFPSFCLLLFAVPI